MAITCCCGINRLPHSNSRDDFDQNNIHELATVISYSEVEESVVRIVSKLFHKVEKVRIQWENKCATNNENHSKPNNMNKNVVSDRMVMSTKHVDKPPYCEIFKDRSNLRYAIFLPLSDETEPSFSGQLLFFCQSWDHRCTKLLDSLERQMKIMFQRLNRMRSCGMDIASANNTIAMPENVSTETLAAILSLCGQLNDRDPTALQIKILDFLKGMLNVQGGFILMLSSNCHELECHVVDSQILDPELRCQLSVSILDSVVKEREALKLRAPEIGRKLPELENLQLMCPYEWQSLLAVPITSKCNDDVVAVVCVVNKLKSEEFQDEDVELIQMVFRYTIAVLTSSIAYCLEKRLKTQTETMLQVAMNIFRKLDNLPILLKEIMAEAKKLTNAERCSVFLLEEESNELVAKVFDGLATVSEKSNQRSVCLTDEGEVEHPKEIRIPASQGIAGNVASTGKILNIADAYSHPLFYRGVDEETGYRTRNILCFPIKDENAKVVGVAQLCNKVNGPFFTCYDEELAKVFSTYCCISIVHSLMYKNVQEAQHRNKLANELMMYHMQITEENFIWLSTCDIPECKRFSPDFNNFESIPRTIEEKDSIQSVLSMFQTMKFIQRWRISRNTLARFILMVKRGYRDPPYHNWTHAFSVAHFVYLCVRNLDLYKQLTDIELFSFFVASLCHDIDHRGTNNSFQVTSKSVLAALYSSEGSVLERHHFNQTVCILNTEGCNILENLSRQEYQTALDLIRDIILATDLAHHFKIISQQREMAESGFICSNVAHRKLLLFLLMTCSDLSDQSKGWDNTRNVARLIYEEFFTQGDLEKAIGQSPAEQMDRERACIPSLQISFLDAVAKPCFELFARLYPVHGQSMVDNILRNRSNWERLHNDIKAGKMDANIFQLFHKEMSPTPLKKT